MPSNASVVQAIAWKDGSLLLLARVVNWAAEYITLASISSIAYTVSLVDEDDEDVATAVTGHNGEAIAKADAVFDTLQTGDIWTVDDTGYNFKYQIDVSTDAAFSERGRTYLVEVVITPTSGQAVRWSYRVEAI